jgi:hypothetical protein
LACGNPIALEAAMSNSAKIGLACPIAGERAAFQEWLIEAGYQAMPVTSIETAARDMKANPFEAIISDVSLVSAADLPRFVKLIGYNRPLVLVGNPDQKLEDVPRDATWLQRPVTRDTFLLSIALALAEGRPARRSPRVVVSHLQSSIDGIPAKLLDVSAEGVRFDVPGAVSGTLPPEFILKVPAFGVAAKVKRVWVAQPGKGHTWCGGTIERVAEKGAKMAWPTFVKTAPYGNQTLLLID